VVLPTDDTNLETAFSAQDYIDVATDDGVRVDQSATGQYAEFLFKDKDLSSALNVTITWDGQSSLAPSSSPVILQVFNRTAGEWETIAQNNTANADTDFTLTYVLSDLDVYRDINGFISCRVYQNANI